MGLYKDAAGQLVVATSLPPGGTPVSGPASSALVNLALWLRGLDAAGDNAWHPASYFAGVSEDASGLLQMQADIDLAQSTADGKIVTFYATTTPTPDGVGDLWFNTNTGSLKRWNGSAWLVVSTVGANGDNLLISPSGNLIHNADFNAGIQNWVLFWNQGGGTNYTIAQDVAGAAWSPAGSHALGVYRPGTTQAAAGWFYVQYNRPYDMGAGITLELSAFMAAHRCSGYVGVTFYDAANVALSEHNFGPTDSAKTGGQNLADWDRIGGFFTTPAHCSYIKIHVIGSAATAANPTHWITKIFLGIARAGQAVLSPWTPSTAGGALSDLSTINDPGLLDAEVVTTNSIATGSLMAIDKLGAFHAFTAKNTAELLLAITPTAVTVAIDRIVMISLEITTSDVDPGYLQFSYTKGVGGPAVGFATLDITSVQANGTQNHMTAAYTVVIPYAANNTDTFYVSGKAVDGSGSAIWSATPGCSIQTFVTIFSAKK